MNKTVWVCKNKKCGLLHCYVDQYTMPEKCTHEIYEPEWKMFYQRSDEREVEDEIE